MVKRAGWWQALKRRSTRGRSVPNNGMIGVGTVADHPSDKTLAVALYLNRRLWPFTAFKSWIALWRAAPWPPPGGPSLAGSRPYGSGQTWERSKAKAGLQEWKTEDR